ADVEVALHFDEARVERGDEVVGDPVRDRLVERPLVAEGPEVELERLQLHAALVGDVADADRGEVGLPGDRAEAGELGGFEVDLVVARRRGIGEGLELPGRLGGHHFLAGGCAAMSFWFSSLIRSWSWAIFAWASA